jgi:hypothetical protein
MKRIALGLAFAIGSVTSVASGTIAVRSFADPAGQSEAAVDLTHENLAANCWVVTGATKNAGCSTSATDPAPPSLPDLPALPGLPDVSGASELVSALADPGQLPDLDDLAGDVADIADVPVPSACRTAVPVSVPAPKATFAAGMSLIDSLTAFARSQLTVPALPVDVAGLSLPLEPPATPDVVGAAMSEAGCLASAAGPSPVPALCGVTAGAPVVSLPAGPLSGLLRSVVDDIAGITGQAVTVNSGNSLGVNCTTDPALPELPALPSAPSLPELPVTVPTMPSVPNPSVIVPKLPATPQVAVPTIPSLPRVTAPTVPVITVPDLSDLPLDIPSLPTLSCEASGSGSASTGLLGTLTATLTGSC